MSEEATVSPFVKIKVVSGVEVVIDTRHIASFYGCKWRKLEKYPFIYIRYVGDTKQQLDFPNVTEMEEAVALITSVQEQTFREKEARERKTLELLEAIHKRIESIDASVKAPNHD